MATNPQPPIPARPRASVSGIVVVIVVAVIASAATTLALNRLQARDADTASSASGAPGSPSAQPSSSEPVVMSLEGAVAAVMPAVVSIATSDARGSGVVVSKDGWILTNRHVVDCNKKVDVTFADGRDARATVQAIDSLTDLALLRTSADGLTPAVLGEAGALDVGQPVAAIGNSEGYLTNTVTSGVVSAPWRQMFLDEDGE